MAKRKTRVRQHVVADMSLHYVAYLIVACGFTVEPTRADYGYDLSVFTFDDVGQYENGNLFVQLKATDRLRRDQATGQIRFRITKRDLLTWESEPFPAYLVVFDPSAEKAYSVYLQRYFMAHGISSAAVPSASLEIRLPATPLDQGTIRRWRDDKNAVLTQMGAVTHV